jgi:NAD(P)-dependent dehydrogenase (short-subunit alcohol dehydrogenase family)
MPALENMSVIVTGAAQGIGECVTRMLAEEGARLMLADIQAEKVAAVAESLRDQDIEAYAVTVDITDLQLVQNMVDAALEKFGDIDALVNVAGLDAPRGIAWEIDEEHWRHVIDVDLNGPWWCTKAVLPHMMEKKKGKIVTISSMSARVGDPFSSPAYAAAKAGLVGMTLGLAAQLESHGILVNAIMPGVIGTTGSPMQEGFLEMYEAMYPLGAGGPQPVAHAVTYLLGPSGDWISGVAMNVSGGLVRGI